MDNGIVLIVILVAAVVGSTIVWLGLRRNIPPNVSLELAAYVAAIRAAAGNVVDAQLITTLAGYAYDSWANGSNYISRADFIAYVLAALKMEPVAAAQITSRRAMATLSPAGLDAI